MPLYEYGCKECGHRFDIQQKLADAALVKCPECSKDALEKIISATSFVLKGGGWYKDGYGNTKSNRTENQRIDKLSKSIDDDKKKTATAAASTDSSSSTSASSTSASSTSDSGTKSST